MPMAALPWAPVLASAQTPTTAAPSASLASRPMLPILIHPDSLTGSRPSISGARGSIAMSDTNTQKLSLLAKLVLAFILMMIIAGVLWHGVSAPTFQRIWHDLVGR